MQIMTIYKKIDKKNVAVLEVLVPIVAHPRIRLISRIHVPEAHRGNKVGTRLLESICEIADNSEYTLYIHLFQIEKKWRKRTVAWLHKFNFRYVQTDLMARLPSDQVGLPSEIEILEVKRSIE